MHIYLKKQVLIIDEIGGHHPAVAPRPGQMLSLAPHAQHTEVHECIQAPLRRPMLPGPLRSEECS